MLKLLLLCSTLAGGERITRNIVDQEIALLKRDLAISEERISLLKELQSSLKSKSDEAQRLIKKAYSGKGGRRAEFQRNETEAIWAGQVAQLLTQPINLDMEKLLSNDDIDLPTQIPEDYLFRHETERAGVVTSGSDVSDPKQSRFLQRVVLAADFPHSMVNTVALLTIPTKKPPHLVAKLSQVSAGSDGATTGDDPGPIVTLTTLSGEELMVEKIVNLCGKQFIENNKNALFGISPFNTEEENSNEPGFFLRATNFAENTNRTLASLSVDANGETVSEESNVEIVAEASAIDEPSNRLGTSKTMIDIAGSSSVVCGVRFKVDPLRLDDEEKSRRRAQDVSIYLNVKPYTIRPKSATLFKLRTAPSKYSQTLFGATDIVYDNHKYYVTDVEGGLTIIGNNGTAVTARFQVCRTPVRSHISIASVLRTRVLITCPQDGRIFFYFESSGQIREVPNLELPRTLSDTAAIVDHEYRAPQKTRIIVSYRDGLVGWNLNAGGANKIGWSLTQKPLASLQVVDRFLFGIRNESLVMMNITSDYPSTFWVKRGVKQFSISEGAYAQTVLQTTSRKFVERSNEQSKESKSSEATTPPKLSTSWYDSTYTLLMPMIKSEEGDGGTPWNFGSFRISGLMSVFVAFLLYGSLKKAGAGTAIGQFLGFGDGASSVAQKFGGGQGPLGEEDEGEQMRRTGTGLRGRGMRGTGVGAGNSMYQTRSGLGMVDTEDGTIDGSSMFGETTRKSRGFRDAHDREHSRTLSAGLQGGRGISMSKGDVQNLLREGLHRARNEYAEEYGPQGNYNRDSRHVIEEVNEDDEETPPEEQGGLGFSRNGPNQQADPSRRNHRVNDDGDGSDDGESDEDQNLGDPNSLINGSIGFINKELSNLTRMAEEATGQVMESDDEEEDSEVERYIQETVERRDTSQLAGGPAEDGHSSEPLDDES